MKNRPLKEKRFKKLVLDCLLKIFYSMDISGKDFNTLKDEIIPQLPSIPDKYKQEIEYITLYYLKEKEKIDQIISSHLINWRLDRVGFLERATLRIGVSYILCLQQTTPKDRLDREISRIISFLLEILECYGTSKKGVRFVNGILSAILKHQTTTVQIA